MLLLVTKRTKKRLFCHIWHIECHAVCDIAQTVYAAATPPGQQPPNHGYIGVCAGFHINNRKNPPPL